MAETPFSGPEGLAFTTRQVMYEGWPILLVTHDADDGAWQFVNGHGDTDDVESAMLVDASRVVARDPEIAVLADLPLGWRAWRSSGDAEWTREPHPGHP